MGQYSDTDIGLLKSSYKMEDLEGFIKSAEEDLELIPKLTETARQQIIKINEAGFETVLILEEVNIYRRKERFGVYILKAPKGIDFKNTFYNFEESFPIIKKYFFLESESRVAISCCEEIIKKYSIPRERFHAVGYTRRRYRKWIESIFDDIYSGKSYKESNREFCYSEGIYYDYKSNINNAEQTQSQSSKFEGTLPDGRPFKAIYDGYSDAWFVRFTFSSEDIELYEKEDLIRLLEPELGKHDIPQKELDRLSAGVTRDEKGHRIWSVLIGID